jgi:hypothetical protein
LDLNPGVNSRQLFSKTLILWNFSDLSVCSLPRPGLRG